MTTSAATALIGVAILVSLSRGALLGTLGGLAAMAMLAGRRSRGAALLAVLAVLLFGLVGGYALVPASVQARLAGILADVNLADVRTAYVTAENFAVLEREAHWLAGLNMVSAHPFLGVGLGNFNVRFAEFTASPTFLISQGHAHNYYIQVAAEAGLIGLAAYLLLLGAIVLAGARALRATAGRDSLAHALVVAACGVVTAVAIHNLFEVLHVLSMGVQLSAIWAFFTIAQQSLPAADGQGGLADRVVA